MRPRRGALGELLHRICMSPFLSSPLHGIIYQPRDSPDFAPHLAVIPPIPVPVFPCPVFPFQLKSMWILIVANKSSQPKNNTTSSKVSPPKSPSRPQDQTPPLPPPPDDAENNPHPQKVHRRPLNPLPRNANVARQRPQIMMTRGRKRGS